MTKKDYILIAGAIKTVADKWIPESKHADVISRVAYQLADELEKDNTKFNRDKFLKACMPE